MSIHRKSGSSSDDLEGLSPIEQINARREPLHHQLFEALIWDGWLQLLESAFRGQGGVLRSVPDFTDYSNPHSIKQLHLSTASINSAREHQSKVTGRRVTDDQLLRLVVDLLADELSTYNVQLRWINKSGWIDGVDRIICVFPGTSVGKGST